MGLEVDIILFLLQKKNKFAFRFHTLENVIILEPCNDVCCSHYPCGEDLIFFKV